MWLITSFGFFSVVQKPGDKAEGSLTVRARVAGDLDRLRSEFLPSLGPTKEHAGTDYRYRARAPRGDVAVALANIAMSIEYGNFKDEVAKRQGKTRAATYGKVWDVLFGLKADEASKSASVSSVPKAAEVSTDGLKVAYGGVVLDAENRVLLREPARHFDGYVWTFPKGQPDKDKPETPEQVALREVKEETGYKAKITRPLPGSFAGGTTVNRYFLMVPAGAPGKFDKETASIRWATFDEAADLIAQTTNAKGRERDLAVLAAARAACHARSAGRDETSGQ
ncbi:NUDIX hydrolase [Neoroseomonas oryzicola]|nr:NUDIX hydrolase [Neoroseomonas oryzicola]